MTGESKKIFRVFRWCCAFLVFLVYILQSPLLWLTYYSFQSHMMEICEHRDNPKCKGKCCVEKNENDNKEKQDIPKVETRVQDPSHFITTDIVSPRIFFKELPRVVMDQEHPLEGVSFYPGKPPNS